MKCFTARLITLSLALTPALACLQSWGTGTLDPGRNQLNGGSTGIFVMEHETRQIVCSDTFSTDPTPGREHWYVDKDSHLSINCLPGYYFAVEFDNPSLVDLVAWYGTPGGDYSFRQKITNVKSVTIPGAVGSIVYISWDSWNFC